MGPLHRSAGRPVAPAIVWQDTRTTNELDALTDHVDADQIQQKTGLPLATYFSGPKLRWILHRDPDTYRDIPESIRRYPGSSASTKFKA